MNERTSEGIRTNSRVVGIAFQVLAMLTFSGTIILAFKVANLGSEVGVQPSNDPAPWLIFAAGTFASLLMTGIGSTLGMLCAIYDRQVSNRPPLSEVRLSTPASPPLPPRASAVIAPPSPPTIHESYRITPRSDSTPTPSKAEPTNAQELNDATEKKSGLWQQLTKERHFFEDAKKSGDQDS
jgi:hypothetical protein